MKRTAFLLTVMVWTMIGHASALDFAASPAPSRNDGGQPCREFQQTIVIDGREEMGYGTVCRQPDGTWQIVPDEVNAAMVTPAGEPRTVYIRETVQPYPYYYDPWGYRYPYWYPFPFALSLGYFHHDGGHHHGGYYGGKHYGGKHHGGYYGGSHKRFGGKHHGDGHARGGGYRGNYRR